VSDRGLVVPVDGRRMISTVVGIALIAAGAILRSALRIHSAASDALSEGTNRPSVSKPRALKAPISASTGSVSAAVR